MVGVIGYCVELLASQYEVDDGEAETVGEVLDISEFMINFCPFCGEKLNDLRPLLNPLLIRSIHEVLQLLLEHCLIELESMIAQCSG